MLKKKKKKKKETARGGGRKLHIDKSALESASLK
jgi:hypothetical protein